MKRQLRALIEQYLEQALALQNEKQTPVIKGQLYVLENVIEDLEDVLAGI